MPKNKLIIGVPEAVVVNLLRLAIRNTIFNDLINIANTFGHAEFLIGNIEDRLGAGRQILLRGIGWTHRGDMLSFNAQLSAVRRVKDRQAACPCYDDPTAHC